MPATTMLTVTMADCAAAPSLFYADWTHTIDESYEALRAYRARLLARPSFARAVDEARLDDASARHFAHVLGLALLFAGEHEEAHRVLLRGEQHAVRGAPVAEVVEADHPVAERAVEVDERVADAGRADVVIRELPGDVRRRAGG